MHIRSVLVRRLVELDAFAATVHMYETLIRQPTRLHFAYPEKQLMISQVGQVLIIGGSPDSLAPFRATAMTFLVSDLPAYVAYLPTVGATIVRPIQRVPSGHNMLVRHADDTLVEYVEHDHPNPADDTLGISGLIDSD